METVSIELQRVCLKSVFEGCVFYKQRDPPIHQGPSVVIG